MGSALVGSLQNSCFLTGICRVLPLVYFYILKSARAYLFTQSVNDIIVFAAAPLVLTPFLRSQTNIAHIHVSVDIAIRVDLCLDIITTCIHIYIYIYIYVSTYLSIYILYLCICMIVCIKICIHVFIYIYIYIYTYMYIYVYIYRERDIHTSIYIYIYILSSYLYVFLSTFLDCCSRRPPLQAEGDILLLQRRPEPSY